MYILYRSGDLDFFSGALDDLDFDVALEMLCKVSDNHNRFAYHQRCN